MARRYPGNLQKYCEKCGVGTIISCPSCQTAIRGYDMDSGVIAPYVVPSFCYECGKAFPWVEARINAARDLFDELDELDAVDREILK